MSSEESLLSGLAIDAQSAADAAVGVKCEALKPVAAAFAKNIVRVRNTLQMPELTTQILVTLLRFGVAFWQRWRTEPVQQAHATQMATAAQAASGGTEAELTTAMWLGQEALLKEGAEKMEEIFNRTESRETASKLLGDLQQMSGVREWIEGQFASAIATTWTAVECVAADAWVAALNASPMKFYKGVISGQGTGDNPGGLSKKQIAIALLAKHKFDVRNSLGILLKPKFDLTSLKNIRIAYKAAFGKCDELNDSLSSKGLNLLEASRHVIVHRAGIVDAEFMKRTKAMSVGAMEGAMLPLSGQWVSTLVNAGVNAGCSLVRFVDAKLVVGATDGSA